MGEPTAVQHIYTRVSKTQSPRHMEGFQTLFLTLGGLKQEAASHILEPRLFYSDAVEYKRVFFSTEGDHSPTVVANLVRLDDSDEHGRRGLYLAHTLVLKSDSFSMIGGNPYALYDSFKFAVSLDDAFRLGDLDTGDIPSAALEVSEAWGDDSLEAAEDWPPSEVGKLAFLGMNAKDLKIMGKSLALVGPQDEIDNVLRVVGLVLPSELMRHCSFDTCCLDNTGSRASITKTSSPENKGPKIVFWALGFPKEPPQDEDLIVVDVKQHRVYDDTIIWKPSSFYELWLDSLIREGRWREILLHKDRAYAIGASVDPAIRQLITPELAPNSILWTLWEKIAGIVTDWGDRRNRRGCERD